MDERARLVSDLPHEVRHVDYRITDGADDDWASFYGDWQTRRSELGDLLGRVPVRSHLVHAVVQCDRDYAAAERWEHWYAARVVERFG